MEIKSIFVDENTGEGLYGAVYHEEMPDEVERLFNLWNDTEYLKKYFVKNKIYLDTDHFNQISIDKSISKVLDEQYELENLIFKHCEEGFSSTKLNLQMLFQPIGKQYTIPLHQETKAKIESRKFPRFLRMYAIRIGVNSFIVTGGAIKLTKKMEEHPDTVNELMKIRFVKEFLKKNGIKTQDDLNYYYEQP